MSAPTSVSPERWKAEVAAAREGFPFLEWLAAVDEIGRADVLRVVLVLRSLQRPAETRVLSTVVPRERPRLDSVRDLFAGAGWHEREAAEMFGVEFVGGDPRRLLLSPGYEGTPLRKDEVLAARAGLPWPGAKEPGERDAAPSRRRMVPPGVPDPEVWGDRDATTDPPSADEVAAAVLGGRVRRRRS